MPKENADIGEQQEHQLDLRRKKLLWRATHRGTKEMDLMLGQFAKNNLNDMSEAELDLFEDILHAQDVYISDWLTGKSPIPQQYQNEILAAIKRQTFVSSDYNKN